MIVYKASDVKLSWQHNHPPGEMGAPKTCGYVKEPFDLEGSGHEHKDNDNEYTFEKESLWTRTTTMDKHKDASIAEPLEMENDKKRVKRQSDQYEYTPTKTRCPLLLVADYRFFQEMGGGNTKTTINYLVNIM